MQLRAQLACRNIFGFIHLWRVEWPKIPRRYFYIQPNGEGRGGVLGWVRAPWDVLALCLPLNCGIDGIPSGHHPAMMMLFSIRFRILEMMMMMMMLAHVLPRIASGYFYWSGRQAPAKRRVPQSLFFSPLGWMCAKYFTLIISVSQKCNKCPMCYLPGGWIGSDQMGCCSENILDINININMFCLWEVFGAGFVCSTLAAIRLVNLFRIFPFHFTPLDVALICGDSLCLAVRS